MDFQHLKLSLYSVLFRFGHINIMFALSIIFAALFFLSQTRGWRDRTKISLIVLATGFAAFWGARIFHVLIENPSLFKGRDLIFSRTDGMTFNGSLVMGFLTFFLGIKFFAPEKRPRLWDAAGLVTALSYGLLRIGCFASGCCWGKVSAVPWSVKYFNSHHMPWWGIPVHPVQLYDAILGFGIFAGLLVFKKTGRFQGRLFEIFILMYAVGRFFTEFYRGDSFRGVNIFLGLSTSQLVSLALILILAVKHIWRAHQPRFARITKWGLSAFLFSGCLPQAPHDSEFKSVQKTATFEIYETKKSSRLERKNVLFIASDEKIQFQFSDIIRSVYPKEKDPRIENLAFWQYSKDFQEIYNVVVRIPIGKIGYRSIESGIKYMESLGEPYDLFFMTHGLSGNLSTGKGYFLSYREIPNFKGIFKNLNLVVLQACYSQSLAPYFKSAGAKAVMSYPEGNPNYFFFGVFLKYYYPGSSVETAYHLAKENFEFHMGTSPYDRIIDVLAKKMAQVAQKSFRGDLRQSLTAQKEDFLRTLSPPILD